MRSAYRNIERLKLDDCRMIDDSDCIIKRPELIADERDMAKLNQQALQSIKIERKEREVD